MYHHAHSNNIGRVLCASVRASCAREFSGRKAIEALWLEATMCVTILSDQCVHSCSCCRAGAILRWLVSDAHPTVDERLQSAKQDFLFEKTIEANKRL